MGEYFNNKKLGTGRQLMDVSRNQLINEIKFLKDTKQCNTNYRTLENYLDLKLNFIFRFPYEEELNNSWDEDNLVKDFSFSVNPEFVEIPHNENTLADICGDTYKLPFCPLSKKAKELGVVKRNDSNISITIFGEEYSEDNPDGFTLFTCTTCEKIFCIDKKESLYVKKLLNKMGYSYIASCIKYKNSEEMISMAKELSEYATKLDINRDSLTYTYQDALKFIKIQEEEDDRNLTLDELKEILDDKKFCCC
ncbi:hypothetical protein OD350_29220 (plasmid) [Clostridium beijerinckii]|uniref:hypothetical protein n=1 Tax=Clostridium beijerinckii TaxID=1520 RepID=UPI002225EC12|nr:hypothetical protein [Clostridium beijerinckii]UYZ38971.1 hypothetical protein OD350_29220 [Clostridium beijerinckii]